MDNETYLRLTVWQLDRQTDRQKVRHVQKDRQTERQLEKDSRLTDDWEDGKRALMDEWVHVRYWDTANGNHSLSSSSDQNIVIVQNSAITQSDSFLVVIQCCNLQEKKNSDFLIEPCNQWILFTHDQGRCSEIGGRVDNPQYIGENGPLLTPNNWNYKSALSQVAHTAVVHLGL